MEAFFQTCPACGWQGYVRASDLWRACPRKRDNGLVCATPFAGSVPEGMAGREFYRKPTDAELGELALLRLWNAVPGTWVRTEDGRVLRYRPHPKALIEGRKEER